MRSLGLHGLRTPLARLAVTVLFTLPALFAGSSVAAREPADDDLLDWSEAPPLPDPVGFAGPFAGTSEGTLLVAGGANFPAGMPWAGGEKVWHDRVFALPDPAGRWREFELRLPRPLGYGVSVPAFGGVLCIGGSDAERCYAEVFLLRIAPGSGDLVVEREVTTGNGERLPLPPLPFPLAFGTGARLGNSVIVAGGQSTMGAEAVATRHCFRLDLAGGDGSAPLRWEELPWPSAAPARVLALAAAQSDGQETCFYLMSGRDAPGVGAEFLTDCWRLSPRAWAAGRPAWRRVSDSPRCVMAGSAAAVGSSHVLVIGGDDGRHFGQPLEDRHPGFARDQLFAYHTITDRWVAAGELPQNPVTTTAVPWRDARGAAAFAIPSGEVRPGVRSPRVWLAAVRPERGSFGVLDYTAVAVYLIALVAMGFYFARREKSTERFFLAGRRIPWWAAGLSIFGTQLSAITFMALPAKVYATDWVYFLGNMMIVVAAPLIVYLYLPFFRRQAITTAYQYLGQRFGTGTRMLGAASFVLFQLGRMGIVLYLPALALATVTGVDVYACILVMGVLATLYTVLGGIEAVIWTDVIQVFVLLGGGLLSVAVIAAGLEGGLSDVVGPALAAGKFQAFDWTWDATTAAVWVVVLGRLMETLVPYGADQTVVQRYLTTPDEKSAARSVWTNAVLTLPATVLFFFIGTALWAFYRAHPERLSLLGSGNDIFPWFIARELPAGLAGLVIAGLFAAAMSSLDSSMNSIATVITTDFFRPWRPATSDRASLRLARAITVLVGALGTGFALYMARLASTSMWDNYSKVIGLFGSGLAGLFLLGMLTRRTSPAGACAGFLASGFLLHLTQRHTSLFFMLYPAIGILSCVGLGMLFSRILPARHRDLAGLTVFDGPRRSA